MPQCSQPFGGGTNAHTPSSATQLFVANPLKSPQPKQCMELWLAAVVATSGISAVCNTTPAKKKITLRKSPAEPRKPQSMLPTYDSWPAPEDCLRWALALGPTTNAWPCSLKVWALALALTAPTNVRWRWALVLGPPTDAKRCSLKVHIHGRCLGSSWCMAGQATAAALR